jgi:hypothetical protein
MAWKNPSLKDLANLPLRLQEQLKGVMRDAGTLPAEKAPAQPRTEGPWRPANPESASLLRQRLTAAKLLIAADRPHDAIVHIDFILGVLNGKA